MYDTIELDRLRRSRAEFEQRAAEMERSFATRATERETVGLVESQLSDSEGAKQGEKWALGIAQWKQVKSVADSFECHLPDGASMSMVSLAYPEEIEEYYVRQSASLGAFYRSPMFYETFIQMRFKVKDAQAFALAFIEAVDGVANEV